MEPPGSPNDRPWVFGTWGNDAPEEKLGIGLPFYSHSVTSPDVTHSFSQLVASGTTSDGNYYTIGGRSVWLPGPALAAGEHLICWWY